MESKLELLAPAGDMECFKVAIDNGADAVYLGLPQFNARMKAQNFTYDDLKVACDYAHFRGKKVYITLNILLKDSEILDAIEGVEQAITMGADAFIVQDIGLIALLNKLYNNLEIHLSTQAGVHNLEGAKVAERLGVKRVVLSRETKLKDIKEIHENTNLELEYFVQGALCIAFSGNCYLSSKLFNMSGNRGLCKQLCRLPYTYSLLGDTKKGYNLSAKDLCMLQSLKDLIDAGVTSFKIEGRMRRPNYVGEAVTSYRKALDETLSQKDIDFLEKRLKVSFNRGFTYRGYLDKNVDIINSSTQNHVGIKIGNVESIKPFKNIWAIRINTKETINKGDGLKFYLKGKEVGSLGVGEAIKKGPTIEIITNKKIPIGADVHLIEDSKRLEVFKSKKVEVPISISVQMLAGSPIYAFAKVDNFKYEFMSEFIVEKAKKSPLTKDQIKDNFSKVGDLGFRVQNIDIEEDGIFIPRSQLNEFRRNIYDVLYRRVISKNIRIVNESSQYEDIIDSIVSAENNFDGDVLDVLSKDTCEKAKNQVLHFVDKKTQNAYIRSGEKVVIKLDNYNEKTLDYFINEYKDFGDIIIDLPIIATGDEIKVIDKLILNNKNIKGVVANNLWGLKYLNELKVYIGQGLNIYNDYSSVFYLSMGANGIVKSEESEDNLYSLKTINYRLPLMTFAHCPYQTMYGGDCSNCKYHEGLKVISDRDNFIIERTKIIGCYFQLYKV